MSDNRDEREFVAAFSESVSNNQPIEWRYWVEQMPTLTAAQAARLMAGLDPDVYQDLNSHPNRSDASRHRSKARHLERLAVAQGHHSGAPSFWLRWADEHKFSVHDGFRLALEDAAVAGPQPVGASLARAHFVIEAAPASVPAELLALPDDAIVSFEHWAPLSHSPRERTQCSSYPAGQLKAEIQERIDRQRDGWFTPLEAAHVIARLWPESDEWDILRRLLDASAARGVVRAYHAAHRLELRAADKVREAMDLLKREELDAWLSNSGYGFPGAEGVNPPTPDIGASVTREPAPDRGRRVKRAALIADNVRRWPTIERDLKDAATNGLSEAAKDGAAVGWWWEGSAIEWARARAKVQDVAPGLAGMTGTIHRVRG